MKKSSIEKRLFIRIESPYKWGKGWTLSAESYDKFHEHLSQIIDKMGHKRVKNIYDVPEGKNKTETSYFHPMELVVHFPESVSEERISEVNTIIKSNLSPNYPIMFTRLIVEDMAGKGMGRISTKEL